jgi:hypothetical protein
MRAIVGRGGPRVNADGQCPVARQRRLFGGRLAPGSRGWAPSPSRRPRGVSRCGRTRLDSPRTRVSANAVGELEGCLPRREARLLGIAGHGGQPRGRCRASGSRDPTTSIRLTLTACGRRSWRGGWRMRHRAVPRGRRGRPPAGRSWAPRLPARPAPWSKPDFLRLSEDQTKQATRCCPTFRRVAPTADGLS